MPPGGRRYSRRVRDLRGSFREAVILRFEPGGAGTASGVSALRRAASHAAHGFDGRHTVSPASLISMSSSPAAATASSAAEPVRHGGSRAKIHRKILEGTEGCGPRRHRAAATGPARGRRRRTGSWNTPHTGRLRCTEPSTSGPPLELDLHLSSTLTRDCTARDRSVGQFCFRGPAAGENRRSLTPSIKCAQYNVEHVSFGVC